MPDKEKRELLEIKKKLKECQQKREEYLSGWKRAKADFLNHEKQEFQRIQGAINQEKRDLLFELLSVEDDLERLGVGLDEKAKFKKIKEGTKQIQDKLTNILAKEGVKKIETKDSAFDPQFHEAVGSTKSRKGKQGQVEEMRVGYFFHDQILRPAQVKIII